MLETAIQNSETALERVVASLGLAAIAMLGLIWLSIAAAGSLKQIVSPPLAAAITGIVALSIAAGTFAYLRSQRANSQSAPQESTADAKKADDVVSRATSIAERMAQDAPFAAFAIAGLAGFASVSLPETFNPFLNKILDDVEKTPDAGGGN